MENHDVYIYTGDIHRDGYQDLTNRIKKRKTQHGLRKDVIFCVATYGGDPNAGYRIGRALQHNYDKVTLLVVGPCKSAGTLIAIAADKLVIGDMGELGPLDIQLKKNDEIGEMSSGLAIMTALDALKDRSISAFNSHLVKIRYENQISTKMSADIATRLTEALVSPMAAQIDPIKLGEHQRAMSIAITYGQRLTAKSNSLKEGALVKLIASYPSHGFVIDRKEAKELFKCVESPSDLTEMLYELFCDKIHDGDIATYGKPKVIDFTHDTDDKEEDTDAKESAAGNGNTQQNVGKPDPGKPRSGKRSRAKPKRDQAPVGAISVQQPDGQQPEA
ncbi:Clp protease/crotonase-like domain-containing protein [Leclercia adecarboxylata]|uniref:SDH family Clp fold serine proteinase n=1 Tax=Leclercia adecarboxylata TaxID=83655 RepID=UPI0021E89CCE|nr:SppA protein [Leclercia adecarboxylata]MCV3301720.1 SppA protein [Leclercia adecarboxylata]MCV3308536.1 SppA protein [Leclercia adecarboxylata]